MTEFELIQVLDMQMNRLMSNSMNFITFLFAYSAASFLVGKQLSRIIATALTSVYSLAVIGPFLGVWIAARGVTITMEQIRSNYPGGLFSENINVVSNMPIVATAVLPLLLGWLISVIYMHAYVRKRVE